MFSFHKPKIYRSVSGCCICRAKSSSSRFTDSKKYEAEFEHCFRIEGEQRSGEICNACVLLVKRWKKLSPENRSHKHWHHIVDARAGPGVKSGNGNIGGVGGSGGSIRGRGRQPSIRCQQQKANQKSNLIIKSEIDCDDVSQILDNDANLIGQSYDQANVLSACADSGDDESFDDSGHSSESTTSSSSSSASLFASNRQHQIVSTSSLAWISNNNNNSLALNHPGTRRTPTNSSITAITDGRMAINSTTAGIDSSAGQKGSTAVRITEEESIAQQQQYKTRLTAAALAEGEGESAAMLLATTSLGRSNVINASQQRYHNRNVTKNTTNTKATITRTIDNLDDDSNLNENLIIDNIKDADINSDGDDNNLNLHDNNSHYDQRRNNRSRQLRTTRAPPTGKSLNGKIVEKKTSLFTISSSDTQNQIDTTEIDTIEMDHNRVRSSSSRRKLATGGIRYCEGRTSTRNYDETVNSEQNRNLRKNSSLRSLTTRLQKSLKFNQQKSRYVRSTEPEVGDQDDDDGDEREDRRNNNRRKNLTRILNNSDDSDTDNTESNRVDSNRYHHHRRKLNFTQKRLTLIDTHKFLQNPSSRRDRSQEKNGDNSDSDLEGSMVASFLDMKLWRKEKICCGIIFKNQYNEVAIFPRLLRPCAYRLKQINKKCSLTSSPTKNCNLSFVNKSQHDLSENSAATNSCLLEHDNDTMKMLKKSLEKSNVEENGMIKCVQSISVSTETELTKTNADINLDTNSLSSACDTLPTSSPFSSVDDHSSNLMLIDEDHDESSLSSSNSSPHSTASSSTNDAHKIPGTPGKPQQLTSTVSALKI